MVATNKDYWPNSILDIYIIAAFLLGGVVVQVSRRLGLNFAFRFLPKAHKI